MTDPTSSAPSFATLADRFTTTVDTVDAARWDTPSPCDGWSAADLLDHVMTTQRDFLAEHGHRLPDPERAGDPTAAWHAHAAAVTELLDRPGVADTPFDGFFGPTTVGQALGEFYGFDLVIHRWDLARAAGTTTTFTAGELDLVEASIGSWGEHLYMDGICASPVDVPDDASRPDRLLARTGRNPAT